MLGFLVVVIWCILSLPALVYAAWKLYSERRARGAQRPDSLGLQLSVLLVSADIKYPQNCRFCR